jgi:hypothetical protein
MADQHTHDQLGMELKLLAEYVEPARTRAPKMRNGHYSVFM